MGRQELHTDSLEIEQKPPIVDHKDYSGDVVLVDKPFNKDYLDELAFQEEPVTIRLEPSSEKNAATAVPIWVNGKGAEVFQNGRWDEIGYLPVARSLIVKRKYVEVLLRTKHDAVQTDILDRDSDRPNNIIRRFTSAVSSFSILHDANPKGVAWATEMRRRNM